MVFMTEIERDDGNHSSKWNEESSKIEPNLEHEGEKEIDKDLLDELIYEQLIDLESVDPSKFIEKNMLLQEDACSLGVTIRQLIKRIQEIL